LFKYSPEAGVASSVGLISRKDAKCAKDFKKINREGAKDAKKSLAKVKFYLSQRRKVRKEILKN